MAHNDPEAWEIYRQVEDAPRGDPNVHLLSNLDGNRSGILCYVRMHPATNRSAVGPVAVRQTVNWYIAYDLRDFIVLDCQETLSKRMYQQLRSWSSREIAAMRGHIDYAVSLQAVVRKNAHPECQ